MYGCFQDLFHLPTTHHVVYEHVLSAGWTVRRPCSQRVPAAIRLRALDKKVPPMWGLVGGDVVQDAATAPEEGVEASPRKNQCFRPHHPTADRIVTQNLKGREKENWYLGSIYYVSSSLQYIISFNLKKKKKALKQPLEAREGFSSRWHHGLAKASR